jgi:hypothetical protein
MRLSTAERLAGRDMRLPGLYVWNDATLFMSYTELLYVNAEDGKHSDELTEVEEMRSRYCLPVLVTEKACTTKLQPPHRLFRLCVGFNKMAFFMQSYSTGCPR